MPGLLLGAGACDSGTAPTSPEAPAGGGPDIGIITDLPAPASLVGAWSRDDDIEYRGSPALQSTEWRFDGRGTCRLTITIYTVDAIAPYVDESICTYRANGRAITFRFGVDDVGEGDELRVRWSLDGPDVLVLDDERYHRSRR